MDESHDTEVIRKKTLYVHSSGKETQRKLMRSWKEFGYVISRRQRIPSLQKGVTASDKAEQELLE